MLSQPDLMQMKARMLIASRVAGLLINQDENDPLQIPEDQFAIVVEAMESLDQDVRAVLTEVDILRGMVTGQFDFLGGLSHGCDGDVPATGHKEDQPDSSGEQPDDTEVSSTVGSGRSNRKAAKRSKPRRNRRSNKSDSQGVDGETAEPAVDSSTAN